MKVQLASAVIASWVVCSLADDQWKQCRDFTIDSCKFKTEDVITTCKGEDEDFCQLLCSNAYANQCKFFHYDRPQKICTIYGGENSQPYKHCNQFAGPPTPTFSQCKTQDEHCHAFMESNCDYKGNLENGYPGIESAEMCQFICQHAPDCNYFNYNEENMNCDVYDSSERNCRVLIGPPKPSWSDCQPGSNTTTSTSLPSTLFPTTNPITSTTMTTEISTTQKIETTTRRTFDCSNKADGKYPSPYDCAEWYVCSMGFSHVYHCPGSLWYDPKTQMCTIQSKVDCHAKGKYDCSKGDGEYPSPYDCAEWYVCSNGNSKVFKCPGNLWYDPDMKLCSFPSRVNCQVP